MALRVFRSIDILREMWEFQSGYYHDMLPFLGLKLLPRPVWQYSLRTSSAAIDLDPPHALLSAWYEVYGVDRLSQLMRSLPYMREIVLADAIAFGFIPVLESLNLIESLAKCIDNGHLCLAAAYGHVAVMHFLNNCPFGWTPDVMDCAAAYGQLETVRWLHENRSEGCTVNAMHNAAHEGHLSVVEFLHFNRSEGCGAQAMDLAASNGHLHVVQWLHKNRTEGCTVEAMVWAAGNGHLDIVKWLHENRPETSFAPNAIVFAAEFGHLNVVKFLFEDHLDGHKEKPFLAYLAMNAAAKAGNDDIVWALWQETKAKRSNLLRQAKEAGHSDFIQWLRQVSVRQRASAMHNNQSIVPESSKMGMEDTA
ncbi:hypothetical protein H310_04086 [Aphanomyces invadans]|uniref:Uncharacterized protein n=1 Tax=Aphanomyces invadans TaxID=157072 RepID=A0A024UF59_9STRA|nr:hypothetical protein H310_04086 [Aphanomyces invadans]ETW05041.1 hypothetical protein H310_04086 [Aphanomyces invadans]|eukprot:XP_008866479.1 hypothetical protein H310_04086 [Aphanomyces invadans]